MRHREILGLLAMASMTATPAAAQTLFALGYDGTDGPTTLFVVSTDTGSAAPVGPVGFERCSGMDFDASLTLYATCERADGSDVPVLVTVDLGSGVGTEVGPTGISGSVSDISFRHSDGVLFAYDAANDPDHSLYTIDTTTGAATLVGHTGLSAASGNAIAFTLADVLLHTQLVGVPPLNLNSLSQATGLPTPVGQVTNLAGRLAAMEAHPTSGVLYALHKPDFQSDVSELVTVNPTQLTGTTIGATESTLDALAFGPEVRISDVPTLDVLALLVLALALAAGAVWWLAARR